MRLRTGKSGWMEMAVLVIAIGLASQPAWGDDFERYPASLLVQLTSNRDKPGVQALGFRELAGLPEVIRDIRATLVLARTAEGNVAKLILAPGFRKRAAGQAGPEAPVLVLERFETIDPANRGSIRARGQGVVLFDGFDFDLDSGQVVPAGFGGDLRFTGAGTGGPRLVVVGETKLFPIEKPLAAAVVKNALTPGRVIAPADFTGRFTLYTDGRKAGVLELSIDAERNIGGRFQSAQDGNAYAVEGALDAVNPRKIHFTIVFPQARQDYEGMIWSEGKGAISGVATLINHDFAFLALREGETLGAAGPEAARAGR